MVSRNWIVTPRLADTVIPQLLANRGIYSEKAKSSFLEPLYPRDTYDPFLFDDMKKGVDRIFFALQHNQRIGIYGDYDVDGVCATTVLYETLRALRGDVIVHMNHREQDGYGLCKEALEKMAHNGVNLIITNDCGISNIDEVALANALGMDVIITDHHAAAASGVIPSALAIIHPCVHADRYPFKKISGTGSAFKLVQGLLRADFNESYVQWRMESLDISGSPINWEHFEKWLLDAVAIGTVGDCMPLIDENRVFVRYGLMVLKKTRRKALSYFLREHHPYKELSVKSISFFIAPRINAASRMGHGVLGFEMMIEQDEQKAIMIANELQDKNTQRQKLSDRVFKEACALLQDQYDRLQNVLVGWSESWPLGVLGLVANKLTDHFNGKPVFLFTYAHGNHIAGTARSGNGFHITQALNATSQFFTRHGGHACAGGFALKEAINPQELHDALECYADSLTGNSKKIVTSKSIAIESEIHFTDATWELATFIQQCEPFGEGNPKPLFLIKNIEFVSLEWIGTRKNHLRILGKNGDSQKKLIGFSFSPYKKIAKVGGIYDIVAELEKNSWNGSEEIQFTLKDIAYAGEKTS